MSKVSLLLLFSLKQKLTSIPPGVYIGQATAGEDGDAVRSGVTVILPRHPDDIAIPCYAGMHTLNGNGEVSGSYQIKDWGYTNMVRSPSTPRFRLLN